MGSKVLITAYYMPDLDGYACVAAYSEFLCSTGILASPGIFGEIQTEIKYVLNRFQIGQIEEYRGSLDLPIVLVDASDRNGLFPEIDPLKVVEIIDHRIDNDAEAFPSAKVQIEKVGAAATLIAEKFRSANKDISEASATLLYSAIISNTLNFQANVTTERDRSAAVWLNQQLKLPQDYAWEMFSAKSDYSGPNLVKAMNSSLGQYDLGDHKILIIQLEMVGGAELVKNRKNEILRLSKQLCTERLLSGYFMTISELRECKNIFLTDDKLMQTALENVFNIRFNKDIGVRPGLIMRKEIVPLLKEYFASTQNK